MPIFSEDSLPKITPNTIFIPGALCRQWVRCGRPNCRCASGKLHGPYWYRFWRDGERQRKQYVRKRDLPAVQAGIAANQRFQALLDFYNLNGWGLLTEAHAKEIQTGLDAFQGVKRRVEM